MRRLIFYSFLLIIQSQSVFSQNKIFFNYKDGLSNSLVNQIYQDRFGFIWVATEDGLNRFDGQFFKNFMHLHGDTSSLKNNFIKAFGEDSQGNLLVGYNQGMLVYDNKKESFRNIEFYAYGRKIEPNITSIIRTKNNTIWISTTGDGIFYIEPYSFKPVYPDHINNQIPGIYHDYIFEDSDGVLWIASENSGLSSYNPITSKVRSYPVLIKPTNKLMTYISSICEDDNDNLYIGTLKSGLFKLNKKNGRIKLVQSEVENDEYLKVKSLLFDSKKRLWVGTDGKGLRILNKKTEKLEVIAPNVATFDFSKSKIHSIIEDNRGNLWLGIFQKGLFLLPESREMFKHHGYKPFGNHSIGSSCIMSISADKENIWVGTDGDGLYQIDRDGRKKAHILFNNKSTNYSGNNVFSIGDIDDGFLWIGTYLNGLIKFDKRSKDFLVYMNDINDSTSLPNDKISCIVKGSGNKLWLGTFGSGVASLDLVTNKFNQDFFEIENSCGLGNFWVNDIHIDSDSSFWIATFGGISVINPLTKKCRHILNTNSLLPSNIIYCLKQDSRNNLWAGTEKGLVKFNNKRMPEKVYTINEGLPSNVICAIEEDEYNQIWISTHYGLAKLSTRSDVITNYYDYDGIQANEFSHRASCKGLSNEIYFGGINGVTEVVNKMEQPLEAMSEVIITDLILFENSVEIGQKSEEFTIINKSIVFSDTIHLSSNDNAFTIAFTTMEFADRARIDYEFMMEGFERNWKTAGAVNNRATYTNLDHGNYKFKIRGVDGEKVSQTKILNIIIHPPWYKTTFAMIIWSILGTLFIYWLILFFRARFKHNQAQKLNEIKMQFFINISHEIKTPLALILDPLERLIDENKDAAYQKLYHIMHKNASRIFRLINQLLDIRKIDKKQLIFKFRKTKIYDFILDVSESYKLLAIDKNIKFDIKCDDKDLAIWIDPLNFEKVIINLLSNAFKFTQANGSVQIDISQIERPDFRHGVEKFIRIIVSDTGIGIKEGDLENIFKRFYQVKSKETSFNTGAGIGLHLTMSIVKKHTGSIYAENRNDCIGSKFTVLIPVGSGHLPQSDLATEENLLPAPSYKYQQQYALNKKQGTSKGKPKSSSKVMIIDDEEDIRQYIEMQLSTEYELCVFANGKVAYSAIQKEKPDLIVCDILMPEMDGITFCKKIKSNVTTNHIPVILLTALSKEENRAEGIETGADMYLTKPFNTIMLKKIIANLIENRQKIINKLSREENKHNIAGVKLKSHDEVLMQKVMTIIKDNIADSSLNVETLADGIGISRVHMHRKLKDITNHSARDFIKSIRMKQAAYLLANKQVNISEIAYAVGYSNLSHFSSTFKAFYGVSPTEYADTNTNEEGK